MHELQQNQSASASQLVPWFLKNMPASYFKLVPEQTRLDNLKALAALFGAGSNLSLTLNSESNGEKEITFIRPTNQIGLFHDLIAELPNERRDLTRAMAFTALDDQLALNVFTYTPRTTHSTSEAAAAELLAYAARVQAGEFNDVPNHVQPSPYFEREQLLSLLSRVDPSHLASCSPAQFLKQVKAFYELTKAEDTHVDVEPVDAISEKETLTHKDTHWITISLSNVTPRTSLKNITGLLKTNKVDIIRAHLDTIFHPVKNNSVTFIRLLVSMESVVPTFKWPEFVQDLKRLKWLDDATMHLGVTLFPSLGLKRAEIIIGLCSLCQRVLSRENSWTYSFPNILQMVQHERYIKHAAAIADLFVQRFDPVKPMNDQDFARAQLDLQTAIDRDVEYGYAVGLLKKMIDAIAQTYRTNFFLPSRYGFALRINPTFMESPTTAATPTKYIKDKPLGVFFVHARRFNAFHVRFSDIARGGVRLVTPQSREAFALESSKHYDEVLSLAYAQQQKNKDIPEGGSKAVILMDVVGLNEPTRQLVMRKSMKAFTDSILDLIVSVPETKKLVIDRWGAPELLYLGPDEQVIPDDISWVVARAAQRGHPAPSTFMSSKADEGINHKEFGVTSEGVAVFLAEALRYKNIDPHLNPFTVKITGGPNGDVAGNMILILFRDYGANARIVGISDHSGVAEDPNGLDQAELTRLVKEDQPIASFNKEKLGPRGVLYTVDSEEGTRMRNTMHFRVVADAFIPAGGRPGSIDISTWTQFLRSDKTPTSSIIVEGANLFITPEAREKLFKEAKVLIVKDSSANKCGVICSSFEIVSSMLLSPQEFRENKKKIVADVLVKLREFAGLEAGLLFREFHNYPGALPHFSELISRVINKVTDHLLESFKSLTPEQVAALTPIFEAHLPPTVRDIARDRIHTHVPKQYFLNAVAARIASQMVYTEGSVFVETLPQDRLAELGLQYTQSTVRVRELINSVDKGTLTEEQRKQVVTLLKQGGVRAMLNME
eukprot:c9127_g1_i1.p1 GENE.c9127_g1_i1~~c9127_g1_i1.p1  ORF type:complete len:1063 (-),score=246.56 c9127_g1_i1:96-3107(-)